MEIKINSTKIEGGTSAAMQSAAEKKLKFLEPLLQNGSVIKITAEAEKNKRIQLKSSVTLYDNHHIRMTAVGDTYYAALDELKAKLKTAVERHRDQRKHFVKEMPVENASESPDISESEINIARIKTIRADELSAWEAADKMDALGHDWFLYRDRETGKLCLLYERVEEGFGLVYIE